jgi:hypothetical protein
MVIKVEEVRGDTSIEGGVETGDRSDPIAVIGDRGLGVKRPAVEIVDF